MYCKLPFNFYRLFHLGHSIIHFVSLVMRKLLTNYKYMLHFIIFFKKSYTILLFREDMMAASFCVWIPCNNSLNCHSIKSFQKRDDHLCIQHLLLLLYPCAWLDGLCVCVYICVSVALTEAITILCRSFYAEARVFSLLLRASK